MHFATLIDTVYTHQAQSLTTDRIGCYKVGLDVNPFHNPVGEGINCA